MKVGAILEGGSYLGQIYYLVTRVRAHVEGSVLAQVDRIDSSHPHWRLRIEIPGAVPFPLNVELLHAPTEERSRLLKLAVAEFGA